MVGVAVSVALTVLLGDGVKVGSGVNVSVGSAIVNVSVGSGNVGDAVALAEGVALPVKVGSGVEVSVGAAVRVGETEAVCDAVAVVEADMVAV
jgi:hypothetical protein